MSYHNAELGLNKSEDTEPHNEIHQTSATPSFVSDARATRLQHLQTELEQFLTQHIEKVNSLKYEVIDIQTQNPMQDVDVQRSPSVNYSRPTSMDEERIHENDASPASISDPAVPVHAEALQSFLESHVENLGNLQRALSRGRDDVPVEPVSVEESAPSEMTSPLAESTTADADKRNEIMITYCAALSQQFTMCILTCTFSSTFMVAALSLTNDMIGSDGNPIWTIYRILGLHMLNAPIFRNEHWHILIFGNG
ncbi:hypothetical protein BDQ12DRAFT_670619 [Crucibulum laeve]|uniref:Uncharacterized protein n=1 Tax=Crucibulum laeve TaxID=68775 RepID=A0A5C3LJX4_9AGAR|nr:hypothetical protein BDQ12DRAFT_670619 [Crucibulum laeve]